MNNAYQISFGDVGLSLIMMGLAVAVSRFSRLGLERNLALGTVRTFIQLTLIGFALNIIFKHESIITLLGIVLVMLSVASYECVRRQEVKIDKLFVIAFISMALGWVIALGITAGIVIRPQPWYALPVAIPLSGMVIGNGMNIISQSVNRFVSELNLRRSEIEIALSLAAPPKDALRSAFNSAIGGALIPSVNALMTVGLVQLPGVMTGQILAGVEPIEAVKFQIVIMMMWVTTGVITGVISNLLLTRILVNRRWQINWDMIN